MLAAMADWRLAFRGPSSYGADAERPTIGSFVELVRRLAPEVSWNEVLRDGNPWNGFFITHMITAKRPDGVRLDVKVIQEERGPGDPFATARVDEVTLAGPTYAAKLAAWHALRDALAALQFTDISVESRP